MKYDDCVSCKNFQYFTGFCSHHLKNIDMIDECEIAQKSCEKCLYKGYETRERYNQFHLIIDNWCIFHNRKIDGMKLTAKRCNDYKKKDISLDEHQQELENDEREMIEQEMEQYEICSIECPKCKEPTLVFDGHIWQCEMINCDFEATTQEFDKMNEYASGGKKTDKGKPRYSLLYNPLNDALVEIFEYGAKKYLPYNWQKLPLKAIMEGFHRHYNQTKTALDTKNMEAWFDADTNGRFEHYLLLCANIMMIKWFIDNKNDEWRDLFK